MIVGTGIAATAALVLLSGCGGSGGTKSASSSSSSATTTTSSSAGGGAQAAGFCGQARSFAAQVASTVGNTGSATTAQKLQQLAAQLNSISPPAEIATDWHTAVSSIQQLGQALQGVNLSDPQQAAAVQQKVAPLEQQLTAAGQHIDAYLQQKCGIDVGGSGESASSTS